LGKDTRFYREPAAFAAIRQIAYCAQIAPQIEERLQAAELEETPKLRTQADENETSIALFDTPPKLDNALEHGRIDKGGLLQVKDDGVEGLSRSERVVQARALCDVELALEFDYENSVACGQYAPLFRRSRRNGFAGNACDSLPGVR
jgi:hypothetical protein